MSQQKKLEFSDRLRTLRKSLDLSQEAMGKRLGVSGNYIHLLEGGREPGDSLLKLFELFETEHSSLSEQIHDHAADPEQRLPAIFARLSIETLISSLADLGKTFLRAGPAERKYILSNLQSILDELHARELHGPSGSDADDQREVILHQKRKPVPANSALVSELAASSKTQLEKMGVIPPPSGTPPGPSDTSPRSKKSPATDAPHPHTPQPPRSSASHPKSQHPGHEGKGQK